MWILYIYIKFVLLVDFNMSFFCLENFLLYCGDWECECWIVYFILVKYYRMLCLELCYLIIKL